MKSKIYRDTLGAVMHIGEWNEDPDPETGEARNPLPKGVYADTAEIATGPDGGRYVTADYIGLRREAYGSWQEQMDLMFHDAQDGGSRWKDHIAAVKATYAKPAK